MARKHDDPVVQERLVGLLKGLSHSRTQGELATMLGLHQPQVSNYLSGLREVPANAVPAIAEAAGVSLDDLYDVGPPPWSKLPGWNEAIKSARALFPRVRTAAFQRVGAIREPPPEELDPAKLGLLASMFDKKVPRE